MRHMSRSEFMVSPTGEFRFLEINTIPGLTATSLFPIAAARAGLDFTALLGRLIELADVAGPTRDRVGSDVVGPTCDRVDDDVGPTRDRVGASTEPVPGPQ
ncbi:MAG: hypothetical protein V3T86_17395 [Planctomycetota bacterium]